MYIESFPIVKGGDKQIVSQIENIVVDLQNIYKEEGLNTEKVDLLKGKLNGLVCQLYGLDKELSTWLNKTI
jgi:hypothetical protein